MIHLVGLVFNEFNDCFTISNDKIGSTNIVQFDISDKVEPVAVPLRRVPLHQREIVQELLVVIMFAKNR